MNNNELDDRYREGKEVMQIIVYFYYCFEEKIIEVHQ